MSCISQGSTSSSPRLWLKICLDLVPRNLEICRLCFAWELIFKQLTTSDSIYAMNGKSVEVDNTDAEGRLVLSGMIAFSDILWSTILLVILLRCYLLHGYGIQTSHFDRRSNSYRVSILITLWQPNRRFISILVPWRLLSEKPFRASSPYVLVILQLFPILFWWQLT